MNATPQDPFERRLSRVPLAPAPAPWRDEILAAARAARAAQSPPTSWLAAMARPWLVPAAAWALVGILTLLQRGVDTAPAKTSVAMTPVPAPTPALLAAARAYRVEILSALDALESPARTIPNPPSSPHFAPPSTTPRSDFRSPISPGLPREDAPLPA
ncbi:MAG: hypothetical protein IT580_08810 [Verrucomicrobiales bacterium]|nr:hypothetical protein [Verrucomicrobiales bacterium]